MTACSDVWNRTWRGMATRCLGDTADDFQQFLLSGGNAGDLYPQKYCVRDSGCLARKNRLSWKLCYTVAGWQEKGYDSITFWIKL